MNVTCNDRERIFEDGTPAEWAALEAHAAGCPICAEELRAWRALSVAAQELRALAVEATAKPQLAERRRWFSFLPSIPLGWQTALAGALVLVLTISAGWIYLRRPVRDGESDKSLLKSAALKDVETAQAAYVQAIDKLAAEAKPGLENSSTPLLANYREKLLVLDSAIADLREQAAMNPSNAQLRYQLLAMYQEKQRTLEEVLGAKQQ
jgi:hypothetical protein